MLRLVFDPEGINECDRCGKVIAIGKEYLAEPDDKEIVCLECDRRRTMAKPYPEVLAREEATNEL